MVKTWFDIDGSEPAVGIYTGDDDAPMYAPEDYIGTRTKFSTKFNYIPFVPAKKIATTVSIPASITDVARGPMRRTITLGAHGMGGVPFIYGFATVGGVIRPLCGSVIMAVNTSTGSFIHWTLGVDETNVLISEGRSYPNLSGTIPGGLSVPVEVYISDKLVA